MIEYYIHTRLNSMPLTKSFVHPVHSSTHHWTGLNVSALIHVPVENDSFTTACLTVKFAAIRHAQVRHL